MLIAARNGFLVGKRVPYDAEVEYLESTGTQWIDTGVEGSSDLDVDFVISSATAPNISMLGIIQQVPEGYFRYHYTPSGSYFAFFVQINQLSSPAIVSYDFAPNKIFHLIVNPTRGIANLNGTSISFTALPQGVMSGLNFYIFARNGFNGIQSAPSTIYSFKMWEDGILIRDLIPVRIGSVGAMYDRRGIGGMNSDGSARNDGLYFNRGTGAFIIGPDK